MSEPRYGFQIPLDVRYLPDGRWQPLVTIRYLSALTQKAYTIEGRDIAGDDAFIFNGSSVPIFSIVGLADRHSAFLGSLVHDYLYANPHIEPKPVADAIFAEIMDANFYFGPYDKKSGEPPWRKALMFTAVSIFGPSHYWDEEGKPAAGFEFEPLGD